jgi:hypothetical protein
MPRSRKQRHAEEEARDARERALAALEPTAVAPGDRRDYFFAVINTPRSNTSEPLTPEPRTPDAEAIRKVLWLEQLVGPADPVLTGRIRDWMVHQGSDFLSAYVNETSKVLALPPSSPWHRAEAAWGAWLTAHVSTFTEQEAQAVGYAISYGGQATGVQQFPGVDRFAFALSVADMWIREGHPGLRDHNYPASEDIVCSVENDYGKLSSYCEDGHGWWYKLALQTDADTQRLTQAVLVRKDAMLTQAVALGIGLSPKTLDILKVWEQDPGVWRDALLAIARENDWHWMRDWLFPEMRRVWAAHPPWRGTILYALAMAAGEFADNGKEFECNVAFDHFAHDFAGGVTRTDFASFLDQAPRAIEFARWLMPDRVKGWSVADVIVPKLDAYFALPENSPPDSPRGPGFGALEGFMCYQDHDLADLAKLKAYFDRRAPSHPGDRLNTLMSDYATRCR